MPNNYEGLPLMMGEKLVGRMDLNEDGTFSGKLDPEMVDLLAEGMETLYSVSFYGRAGANPRNWQLKVQEYITGEPFAETIAEHFYGKVEYVEIATDFLKKYEVKERKPSGTESDPVVGS